MDWEEIVAGILLFIIVMAILLVGIPLFFKLAIITWTWIL